MSSRASHLASLLVVALASLLLLACATTKPSKASQAHAGLDMKGKKCADCHPDGVKHGRAAKGGSRSPVPASSYEQR